MDRDLELAVRAALAAGAGVLRGFGGEHEVTHKAPDQPVTPADLEADRMLRAVLLGGRPTYGWLSEETADTADRLEATRVWIVDPIDGTRSYIAGYPEFAVSVGLAERGTAVLGVVCNPATGELYWAARGEGAYAATLPVRRDEPVGRLRGGGDRAVEADVATAAGTAIREARRLRVTAPEAQDQAVLLASRSEIAAGEFDPFHGGWRILPTGSTAYKLARIAAAEGDVFLSRGPKSEWDVCAGALLIEEAGGRVTDLDGEAIRYNRPDPYVRGVLASNGRLHAYVLGIVRTLPPPPRAIRDQRDPLHPGLEQEG